MKRKLKVMAIIAALGLFTVIPSAAQQGVGATPYAAHLLASGLNVGSLTPGGSFWYSFSQNDFGGASIQSIILNLVFKPGDSRTARQVSLDIYNFDQVTAFLETGAVQGDRAGEGQLVDADYDPETAERLWAGTVAPDEVYYIHVNNASDFTVDYHLVAVPQNNGVPSSTLSGSDMGDTSARNRVKPTVAEIDPANPDSKWLLSAQALQGMSADEAAVWLKNAAAMGWFGASENASELNADTLAETASEAVVAENSLADNSIYPNNPLALYDRNVNKLAPHAEHWYSFIQDDFDANTFERAALTMFVTPGDGNISNLVNFEIFTGDQYQIWKRGTPDDMTNTGAGEIVSRDHDPNTGERVWLGKIADGERYYIRVKNDSEVWVDYYLLRGDVINSELGDAPTVNASSAPLEIPLPEKILPPVYVEPGTDIINTTIAHLGANRGRLSAGDDIWRSFRFQDFDNPDVARRRYIMYLKETPGWGFVANDVNLEIYTADQQRLWLRGDGDQMTPMGVGSRDEYRVSTNTQRFTWDGYFEAGITYYLRIRNDSNTDIFYDLDIQRR